MSTNLIPTAKAAELLGITPRALLALERRGVVGPAIRLTRRTLRWQQELVLQAIKRTTHL